MIVGAGAAGSVATKKCAMNRDVFTDIHLVSRTLAKCEGIRQECATPITTSQVDADDARQVAALIERVTLRIVVNLALPYQDLPIMEASLETGVPYLDTANYEPRDEAKFSYSWQWPYHERYRRKGIMAVLGCGFDPGVISVYCAYAQERLVDEIRYIDIKHLEVLQNVGMTRIDPVQYQGAAIVPLQFLKALLPEPSSLAKHYTGKTSIGAIIQGVKDGTDRKVIIYNVCDHAQTYREVGAQAVSYTTGVPAMTGAMMVLKGLWKGSGVFNVEQFPPEPFLAEVAKQGLPWHVQELPVRDADEPLAG